MKILFFLLIPFFAFSQQKDSITSKQLLLEAIETKGLMLKSFIPFTQKTLTQTDVSTLNTTQDVPFILQQTPSIVSYSDAGTGVGYTGLRMRGTDLTRINVTINGVPYNDAESHNVYFVNISDIISSTASVQIQRGVGSSSNGGSAFGGTINFNTSSFVDTMNIKYIASIGSFNTIKNTLLFNSGLLKNHWTIDGRYSFTYSDGYIERAFSRLNSALVNINYWGKKYSIKLNYIFGYEKTYQAWNGVPNENVGKTNATISNYRNFNPLGLYDYNGDSIKQGKPYDNQTDNYWQQHFQLISNVQLNSKLSFNNTLFTSLGNGYYEEYRKDFLQQTYPSLLFANIQSELTRRLGLDNIFFGALSSLHYEQNKTNISIGLNVQRYNGKEIGTLLWVKDVASVNNAKWYNYSSYKNDINAYIKIHYKLLPNFLLYADAQIRNVTIFVNGFRQSPQQRIDDTYLFFNPKIGFTVNYKNFQSQLSYAIGQKEPNKNDFAGAVVKPQSEHLQDIEWNNRFIFDKITYQQTAYYMYYTNQLVLNGKINDVGDALRYNIDKSYRLGLEQEITIKPIDALKISGNISISQNKILNADNFIARYDENYAFTDYQKKTYSNIDIAFSPNITSNYGIEYKPFKKIFFIFNGQYIGKQYLDNTQEDAKSLDAFYLQHISLGIDKYQIKKIGSFSVQVFLNNIFNKQYEPNGYVYEGIFNQSLYRRIYYFPMAGFNFNIMLKWQLQ